MLTVGAPTKDQVQEKETKDLKMHVTLGNNIPTFLESQSCSKESEGINLFLDDGRTPR